MCDVTFLQNVSLLTISLKRWCSSFHDKPPFSCFSSCLPNPLSLPTSEIRWWFSTARADLFSLCTSSWVICLLRWLQLWFLRVPKFIQLSQLFHAFPKTSKPQNWTNSSSPLLELSGVASTRLGNISSVFNSPSRTHSWVTKSWLICCYHVLWSPPFRSRLFLRASFTSCLASTKNLWTSLQFPAFALQPRVI